MQDDNDSSKLPPAPSSSPPPPPDDADQEYPVDRMRQRLERGLGGRPLMVYIVLIAGAAVLLILLAIVWISATDEQSDNPQPCFDITVGEAQDAIRTGTVTQVEIFLDQDQPELGPSVIRLSLTDGTCRELPKGADNLALAYQIVGFVEVFNTTHEERVRIVYRRTNVLPELLRTSTPTPTITPTPLPTETGTATATVTATATATATVQATETTVSLGSPIASEASPVSE